ncbi:MAG: heme ABC exporter ATP-binding protein CcmA [Erythrobacter sp.]|jgi:heme exporter protein A|nr:heme ABC exporter ATP-binding protein CcmA [Erythrobacter sp.]
MKGSDRAVPALKANALACRQGDRLLFRGLGISLSPGEACHVTGANGAGKTTLIRTLAGLAEPYAGDVRVEGTIGLLDERVALDPDQVLGRALAFWFGIDGVDDPSPVLARLRLADLAEVPVRYLSTGQRKRAAFARLIGQTPNVWLLDEPLSGLDTASQALVEALVAEHCKRGGITLIASHQPLGLADLHTVALEDYAPREEPAA